MSQQDWGASQLKASGELGSGEQGSLKFENGRCCVHLGLKRKRPEEAVCRS